MTELETVTLEDGDARVLIAPTRGGMVTRFTVGDVAVLFLDEASLVDLTKNVRGGIPVLFPSPGPLAGDHFSRDGRTGSMKQHGFARTEAWTVSAQKPNEVTLSLSSNERTRAQFPWDFAATIRYALSGTTLTVATTVRNTDASPLPFSLGFHPYFEVRDADKGPTKIPTDATRAWDNFGKQEVDVTPIDLTVQEVDLHLHDHHGHEATLQRVSDRIVVSGDPEFSRWVVWTQKGKDFVCLEPWTSAANALNTGERLTTLAPGDEKTLTIGIARI